MKMEIPGKYLIDFVCFSEWL